MAPMLPEMGEMLNYTRRITDQNGSMCQLRYGEAHVARNFMNPVNTM